MSKGRVGFMSLVCEGDGGGDGWGLKGGEVGDGDVR